MLKKKSELAKTTNAEATKRQKLTSYISTVLKSRQEEAPLGIILTLQRASASQK